MMESFLRGRFYKNSDPVNNNGLVADGNNPTENVFISQMGSGLNNYTDNNVGNFVNNGPPDRYNFSPFTGRVSENKDSGNNYGGGGVKYTPMVFFSNGNSIEFGNNENKSSDRISLNKYISEKMEPASNFSKNSLSGSNKNNNSEDKTYHDFACIVLIIARLLVLIILTGLVATLFSRNNDNLLSQKLKPVKLVSQSWVITSGDCKFWVDGACIPLDGVPDKLNLGGILEEKERRSTGLFSSINAPCLCLSSIVIATAFSICLTSYPDAYTQKTLKLFSLMMIVVFGVLFLFIQSSWMLPVNNVLFIEFLFMLALFALGTVSVDKGSNISALRLVGWVLSTPLLIVAVLSIAGEDNSNVLLLVYFGLVFSMLVLSVGEWEYSSDYNGNTISVVYMTFWLCIIPFIVYSSKRLHFMAVEIPVSLPKWSIASLGIILGWYVIGAIVSTFHEIMNAHNNNNAKLLYGQIKRSMWGMEIYDFLIKTVISLLITIGYFIEQEN